MIEFSLNPDQLWFTCWGFVIFFFVVYVIAWCHGARDGKLDGKDEAEMERQKTKVVAKRLRKLVKTIYPKSVPWRLVIKGNQASDCIEVIDALIEQTKEQDEVKS